MNEPEYPHHGERPPYRAFLGIWTVLICVPLAASFVSGWLAAFFALAFVLYLFGLLADEDSSHWDWPEGKDGPSLRVQLEIAVWSAVFAGGPLALAWWFFGR